MKVYDFGAFIDRVKDLSYPEILRTSEMEAEEVQRNLFGRGKTARLKQSAGAGGYNRLLIGFLFYMRSGLAPSSLDVSDFQRFRPVVESLVARGVMKPAALTDFEGADSDRTMTAGS